MKKVPQPRVVLKIEGWVRLGIENLFMPSLVNGRRIKLGDCRERKEVKLAGRRTSLGKE